MSQQRIDENITEQMTDADVQKRKTGQMLLILAVSVVLIIGGIIYFNMSLSSKKSQSIEGNDTESLMPLEAQNKKKPDVEKYGKERTSHRKIQDEYSNDELSNLVGAEPTYRKRTNEHLTQSDYQDIANSAPAPVRSYAPNQGKSKEELNRENQARIRNAQRQIKYDANPNTPMFRKSPEEIEAERIIQLERDNNAKLAERIIKNLDNQKVVQQIQQQPYQADFQSRSYRNAKEVARQQAKKEAGLKNVENENTIARATSTGFYTQSTAIETQASSENDFIPAVVHGNGDGIKVQNGSTVKIRLLTETSVAVGGRQIKLTPNTLISGLVQISQDRVNIAINSIRMNNAVIPVQMIAFDIDGTQGLYIPNLADKNLLGRELTNAGTRPLQSSIWTQGSVGQQVGTQIATETARTLIQGGTNYVRRKASIVKVTIKPNYKILLNTGTLSVESPEFTESISNF